MQFSRRAFLKVAGLAGAGTALGFGRAGYKPALTLRILTTTRAFSASLVADFMRQTGVALTVVLADNPTSLANADLAIVPSHALTHFIKHNDVTRLGASSAQSTEQRAYDPLNMFSLVAVRGLNGINGRGIEPPSSWQAFFDAARTQPTYLPARESFGAALKLHGHSINTRDYLARKAAKETVGSLRSSPLDQSTLAISAPLEGWTFIAPTEGAEQWEDCFCLPTASAQPDLARAFIAYYAAHQPLAPLPAHLPLELRSPFAPEPV